MKVNDYLHGFLVSSITELKELGADMVRMTHEKTGLELVWLRRAEENKTFGIAFETLPWNDTGVFHILEHSVLNGSAKYPVKEPFVELIKNSMNTFLNAMTYPDKTFYPVSSRNHKDFINLMRVYLDAVFNPSIYTKPEIFRQEGWHYEIDENGSPSYKGVVFNEMKGAFADADELMVNAMNVAMFPDTPYRYVSGGDPAKIPDLTYEEFINSHRKFYSPSNAYVYLDGDMDIDAVLSIIDEEYLAGREKTERLAPPPIQKAVDGGEQEVMYEISAEENPDGKTRLAWGSVIGSYDEFEKLIAVRLLTDVLAGSNQSPLSKAVLSQGLAEDVILSIYDEVSQPWIRLEAKNIKAENAEKVEKVLFDELRRLSEEGLNHEQLEASMANLEFKMRERDYGSYPQGLIFGMTVLESWLYGGEPSAHLEVGDLFERLKVKLSEGYFEKLIDDVFLSNPHRCKVKLTPSHTAGEERRSLEAKRLSDESLSWTQADRQELLSQQKSLIEWQNSEDTPEQLATLPRLELSDISDEPEDIPTEITECSGIKTIVHDIDTSGIAYINLYFDADDFSADELSKLSFMSRLLIDVDTKLSTAQELNDRSRLLCGNVSFYVQTFTSFNSNTERRTKFVATFSALEKNVSKATDLVIEILTKTVFKDESSVLDILKQTKLGAFQGLVMGGNSIGIKRINAQVSSAGAADEYTSGYTFYKWLKENETNRNWEKLSADLEELLSRAVSKNRLTLTVTGHSGEYLGKVVEKLSESLKEAVISEPAEIKPLGIRREGIVIPADIAFAQRGASLLDFNSQYSGIALLAAKIISYSFLWNVIRVQGGAYGTGMLARNSGLLTCYSYRDPSGAKSLESYLKCGDFLKDMCSQDVDLTGFIIGTVADVSPLMTPRMKGSIGDTYYFMGRTREERCKLIKEILSATPEKLIEISGKISSALENGGICVVAGQNQIDKCDLDFVESV